MSVKVGVNGFVILTNGVGLLVGIGALDGGVSLVQLNKLTSRINEPVVVVLRNERNQRSIGSAKVFE